MNATKMLHENEKRTCDSPSHRPCSYQVVCLSRATRWLDRDTATGRLTDECRDVLGTDLGSGYGYCTTNVEEVARMDELLLLLVFGKLSLIAAQLWARRVLAPQRAEMDDKVWDACLGRN